ncbi:hypothetical protein CDAR_463301 [Caerostris darwini]|uniref:Uncharacterized protein n=1 Tax=Caerostris darwini TaxID=1538125 RepID=A0AAV4UW25_9ARAC|nr:hypothetical protein CDAR_463301 [Caerostris darwini]
MDTSNTPLQSTALPTELSTGVREVLFFLLNISQQNNLQKKKRSNFRRAGVEPATYGYQQYTAPPLCHFRRATFPSSRSRTSDLWIPAIHRYSPPLCQLSYRRA